MSENLDNEVLVLEHSGCNGRDIWLFCLTLTLC